MSEWKKAFLPIVAGAAAISYLVLRVFERVQLMPVQAAREAVLIDHAFHAMVWVTVPIFGLVVATLIYILWNFQARSEKDEGRRFYGSRGHLVETVWISLSVVLTFGLAAYGSEEFLHIRGDGTADLDVQVKASQWSWEFYYPEQDVVSTELILPKDKKARIILTSEDVVHSFWVPAFRIKQDALPGKVIPLVITPTRLGEYDLVCAELCGLDHSLMRGKVKVVEEDDFKSQIQGESW